MRYAHLCPHSECGGSEQPSEWIQSISDNKFRGSTCDQPCDHGLICDHASTRVDFVSRCIYNHLQRPLGGIGRRDGFKIHCPKGVRVRVPQRPLHSPLTGPCGSPDGLMRRCSGCPRSSIGPSWLPSVAITSCTSVSRWITCSRGPASKKMRKVISGWFAEWFRRRTLEFFTQRLTGFCLASPGTWAPLGKVRI